MSGVLSDLAVDNRPRNKLLTNQKWIWIRPLWMTVLYLDYPQHWAGVSQRALLQTAWGRGYRWHSCICCTTRFFPPPSAWPGPAARLTWSKTHVTSSATSHSIPHIQYISYTIIAGTFISSLSLASMLMYCSFSKCFCFMMALWFWYSAMYSPNRSNR